jgi:stage III sporulation protein AG
MNFGKMTGPMWKKILSALEKYKFVLLVILAGVLLLSLASLGETKSDQRAEAESETASFDLDEMEARLEQALSKIDGAGKVTVVLTVKAGVRQVIAQDETSSVKDGDTQQETNAVVVSKGSGYEDVVALQEIYPQFQGALVVCAGGGDPAVKLKLVEAVSALTGLSSNRISICKGK